jgi:hypothetical protein
MPKKEGTMSFKITGTVKFNQFSHEYALDLEVTEAQLCQDKPKATENPFVEASLKPAYFEPKPEPTTYTVQYQGMYSWDWRKSEYVGVNNPFDNYLEAEEALRKHRAKWLNYRIVTSGGFIVLFNKPEETPSTFIVERHNTWDKPSEPYWEPSQNQGVRPGSWYRVTEIPAPKPSTFVVEFELQDGWVRSINEGLRGITFATRAAAEEAKERFGNYGLDYRVTEVPSA